MDEPANRGTVTSILYRDPTVSILFGLCFFLIVFLSVAVIFARSGRLELLNVALLLTMAFAVVGAVIGLVRGLRSGRAKNRRSG
jgi:hypothetical protein